MSFPQGIRLFLGSLPADHSQPIALGHYSSDALREIDAFFRREHRIIIPLTVKEILEQTIAMKLA